MQHLQKTIKAIIRPGDETGFVAECVEIAVVTQGKTIDETLHNLKGEALWKRRSKAPFFPLLS
ncbi:MAG: type II toxin-antitoxin system HicB family antitoxin [Deltaproteobacteria bacterium]|nr:type II toxin-antitoxin system HicB family antitoxin [Deltaproteobacteria bacterium]